MLCFYVIFKLLNIKQSS